MRQLRSFAERLVLLAVVGFFCLPLFMGLRAFDLRNDEAIYSYSVDRILESGDWLTPRIIPSNDPFLEKPPLKFWLVAGAMRMGLLPRDEFGMRFIDALMGGIAFLYVFLLGRRYAGPICGFVAVLVLFTIDSLLYEHGIRGNHMEAPLLLAYCGAIYHYARWVEDSPASRGRSLDAIAAGLYFTLGFMTKFVAVFFLPLVCLLALAWRRDALTRVRDGWRDWVVPALLVLALIAPWFIYQAIQDPQGLWGIMFSEHVMTRFTGVLDPAHQQPWHHYYSHLWVEMSMVGSQWIVVLGAVMLAVKAWQGHSWLARLFLVWWVVPFALMSMGTSKVFHYTFPFLPALAIGAGAAAAALVDVLDGFALRTGGRAARLFRVLEPRLGGRISSETVRRVLLAGAVFAAGLAIWTFLAGRVVWKIDGIQLLKNSTVWRPLVAAAFLLWLAGSTRILSRGVAIAAVAMLLPVMGYRIQVHRLELVDHPLRALRDCAQAVREPRPETHVFPTYVPFISHSYYYYLSPIGPWVQQDRTPTSDDLRNRLYVPGRQSLVILFRRDYETLREQIARGDIGAVPAPTGVSIHDDLVVLTPGPFQPCGEAAVAATLRPIRVGPAPGSNQ